MILKNLHNSISRMATKKGLIVLFVLAHLVLALMMIFTFPKINAKLGTQAFDLRPFGYSHEEALAMIQSLDQVTTNLYLFPQIFLFDILYPVLLGLFLSALIIRLSNLNQVKEHALYSNLYILPFIAMSFDYLENILVALMISGTAEASNLLVQIASISTQLKGLLTTASWIVVIILLILWLKNKRTYKNEASPPAT
jgi:hypothetical protein